MVNFERYKLANGLTVILHQDPSSSLVAVNVLFKVGSKYEDPEHTGFAHLFEHMMFTGSENVPDFDKPIQQAGGENNAFTNADITNYYTILPADNLETALFIEADRMRRLKLNQSKLDIQKKVVIEEFYETCLNQPYGDVWHHISEISYQKHAYKWPTIGLVPEHISKINLSEAKSFYENYYQASNAILVLSGNINVSKSKVLIAKHFNFESEQTLNQTLIQEDLDRNGISKKVKKEVPLKAMYMSFLIPDRLDADYYAIDLLSDLLSNGKSSRFYKSLFKEQKLFTNIDAYISGTNDPGLFIIESKLLEEVSFDSAHTAIWNELEKMKIKVVDEAELQKVKNKVVSSLYYSEVSILNKAINLAYYESIGDASLINSQAEHYEKVSIDDIHRVANYYLTKERCNILEYGE